MENCNEKMSSILEFWILNIFSFPYCELCNLLNILIESMIIIQKSYFFNTFKMSIGAGSASIVSIKLYIHDISSFDPEHCLNTSIGAHSCTWKNCIKYSSILNCFCQNKWSIMHWTNNHKFDSISIVWLQF